MTTTSLLNPYKLPVSLLLQNSSNKFNLKTHQILQIRNYKTPRFSRPSRIIAVMSTEAADQSRIIVEKMNNLLFVEMGVGYDQHGQDITSAAMRACRDAISSNSIPAFRRGSIPGVSFEQMKLQIKLGVPRSLQQSLDIETVKYVFPYGKILDVEVVDGGLICSSGVHVEEMGDKNDDCYIVNAAVYVGLDNYAKSIRKNEDGLARLVSVEDFEESLKTLLEKYEADECVKNRPVGWKNASDNSFVISGPISGHLRGSAIERKPFEDNWKSVGFANPNYLLIPVLFSLTLFRG